MARKKAPAARKNDDTPPKRTEPVPISELATMVLGCKGQRANLLILADWLEERLSLSATAGLLRLPDLQLLSKELDNCWEFDYFALEHDVFGWLARGHIVMDQVGFERKPCVVVGLYAHPEGGSENWAKVVRTLALEEDTNRDPQRPWDRLVKKHPCVEEAREELATFAKRKQ